MLKLVPAYLAPPVNFPKGFESIIGEKLVAIYRVTFSISEAKYILINTLQHSEPSSLDLLTVKYLLPVHSLLRWGAHVFLKGHGNLKSATI